ncbi:TATA box-binding protein-associated factor chain TAFII 90 (nucleomorph) [Cryptomonas paramecium]|uniref:TATA box-binding protein-associated factor chain TAFII 90 n=1 Tax=Cryptomonas paramaecium TaxID=2898 RepID=F2HIA7_9CRYP|nr:TATA box-binding protein-associated factor chain TAFII 90 [Cryptomonas paramecium]AEA39031.1 TATA box-binding protein-associated factor chain TAFII 90 [Cryptomonas paramecium]
MKTFPSCFRKEDPFVVIKNYIHFKKWLHRNFFFEKNHKKNFFISIAILILVDFLKKNFLIPFKIFIAIFNSDKDVFSEKMTNLLLNPQYTNILIEKIINHSKIFYFKFSFSVFYDLISFLEKNSYTTFLKYISKYFHVDFLYDIRNNFDKAFKKLANKTNGLYTKKFYKTNLFRSELKKNKNFLKVYKMIKIFGKKTNSINSVDTSFDENLITLALDNSTVKVFDLSRELNTNLNFSLIGHSASVICAKAFACKNFVVSCTLNGELFLWSFRSKKLLCSYENFNKSIWTISLNKKEKLFSTSNDNGLAVLWATNRLFPLRFFKGHKSYINVIKWHPYNLHIATGSDDGTVRVWDIKNPKTSVCYKKFKENVYNLEFSPNGFEICISGKKYIDIWDIRTQKTLKRINTNCPVTKHSLYSPEGCFLFYNLNQKTLKILQRNSLDFPCDKMSPFKHIKKLYLTDSKIKKLHDIKFNRAKTLTIIGI